MNTTENKLAGFRSAIMVLREVAELMEKHPGIDAPSCQFTGGAEPKGTVKFHAFGTTDYTLPYTRREESKRLSVETQILRILDAFGPEVEWVANDPSDEAQNTYDRNYYVLTAAWEDVNVVIVANRADVGEQATSISSGPQILAGEDGQVQALRQTVTVWTPNRALAARVTHQVELSAAENQRELTA